MSSESKPADSSGIAKSFADRLSFPDTKPTDGNTKFDWADDAATPVKEKAETQAIPAEAGTVSKAQTDGSTEFTNGSNLQDSSYDVNVKLADLQADPNNPLYSVKNFADLNL